MRLLLFILTAMVMVQSANGQSLWRNSATTNRVPWVKSGSTNIVGTLTNNTTGSASSAELLTSTAIGLADTNWVLNLVGSLNQHYYFSSVTNTGIGSATNLSTMVDMAVAAASTNSIAIPTANVYFLSRISTNTVTRIEEGPIHLQTYVYVTGGALVQTVTAHPEMYVWFTNDTIIQIASSGSQVFTEGAAPTVFNTTMNVAHGTNLPYGSRLMLRWKADAVANAPTWNFVIGGDYDSHLSINVPASSATLNASQITGTMAPSQIATNTAAANQVLTATSGTSTKWADSLSLSGSNFLSTVGVQTNGGLFSGTMALAYQDPVNNSQFFGGAGSFGSTSWTNSVGMGYLALVGSPGSQNSAQGSTALNYSPGNNNSAQGYASLNSSPGNNNSAQGYASLYYSPGNNNSAQGFYALQYSPGNNNSAQGYSALNSSPGSYNSAQGYSALSSSPGSFNSAQGPTALYSSPGSYNSAQGSYAIQSSPGSYNSAQGYSALSSLRASTSITWSSQSNYNGLVWLVVGAGHGLTTGDVIISGTAEAYNGSTYLQTTNILTDVVCITNAYKSWATSGIIGKGQMPNYNVGVGANAGYYVSSGVSNVFLGANSGPSSSAGATNKLYIANAPGTPLIGGDFGTRVVEMSGSLSLPGPIKFTTITASNPPTSGTGTAYLFGATNAAGTAEIFTMDGAGVIKQISEHAMDAPDQLIDDSDEAPNISKEILLYTGKVRWINRSRSARQQEMTTKLALNSLQYYQFSTGRTPTQWTNSGSFGQYTNAVGYLDPLTAARKQIVIVESFAEYNSRNGLTNGNGLVKASWTADQARFQADYATSYTNAVTDWSKSLAEYQVKLASFESGSDTNAIAPVAVSTNSPTWTPPAVQAVPAWLQKRITP